MTLSSSAVSSSPFKARFSMSAIGITAMSLAMFATFSVLSQCLQYVRGYSPLKRVWPRCRSLR